MSIGLYVHIPFCLKKCTYCSFVSGPKNEEQINLFLEAISLEIKMYSSLLTKEEKELTSIFVGGGTPTCLSEGQLEFLFSEIYDCFSVLPNAEITVEGNPGTLEWKKLVSLKKIGVNRLSLGFQSCQGKLLNLLGRIHTYSQAELSFMEARNAGFENINVDLIYGIPGQTLEDWSSCLKKLVLLNPEHISAYGLQIEEGTPLFGSYERKEIIICSEDLAADMYNLTRKVLSNAGYIHYEISNFAKPEFCCQHNLRYWHNFSYLGLGPAAHSSIRGKRFSNHDSLGLYVDKLRKNTSPVQQEEAINKKDEIAETIFLGLRLVQGLDLDAFEIRFGDRMENIFQKEIEKLNDLGLLERKESFLRLTEKGLLLGNMVFSEFV
ncbi:MAG: radical SAM family heme chaperone HemW [Peptococcaceae bacterium]|nr:radical SAM family heme chaperone HemW [Peptococcaceae bacterium]